MTQGERRPARSSRPTKLRHDSVPMRLYHEAKQEGVWDPRGLDLGQDIADWARLSVTERDVLLRLTALFLSAEETMTHDLLPLLMTVVREDRLEEELFLTTFLSEEAKHTEFYRRILDEVCRQSGDLDRYFTPSFRKLFRDELPRAMRRLLADPAPVAQAEGLVTYTLVGEGVLGEAGFHVFTSALEPRGILPGFREGLRRSQADEERHMAYGVFLLSRLEAEDDAVWPAIGRRMEALLPLTLGVVSEFFEPYDVMPFDLSLEATVAYTTARFAGRWASLEAARARTRGAMDAPSLEATLRQVLDWVRKQAAPAPVEVRREGSAPIFTFHVGPRGSPTVLVTEEVLEHHSAADIIAALSAQGVPQHLRDRAPMRLTCLSAGGRIVVQGSSRRPSS